MTYSVEIHIEVELDFARAELAVAKAEAGGRINGEPPFWHGNAGFPSHGECRRNFACAIYARIGRFFCSVRARRVTRVNPSTNTSSSEAVLVDDLGIFKWDLDTALLHGDVAFARFFGLVPEIVEKDLSIERYLDVVHADDRRRVARTLRKTIVHGGFPGNGPTLHVTGIGRSFRDQNGEPSRYVGALLNGTVVSDGDKVATLITSCSVAQSLAGDLGMDDVSAMLDAVVGRIKQNEATLRH